MQGADRLLAVFDIDGVLADVSHRLHYLSHHPKDWEAFFASAATDPLLAPGADLVRHYAADHEIRYLTGRPERSRDITETWLAHHELPVGPLLMRPDKDYRPARMYKREALRAIAEDATVALFVDDDPAVIQLLAADGVPVRLAEWLPYAAPLARAQERDGRT